jgi:hypothetical protein
VTKAWTRPRFTTAIIIAVAAVAMMSAIIRSTLARADDDDEKPITSASARVSRGASGRVFVSLQPAAVKEIGLVSETLRATVRPVEVEAYGLVLDPAPLARLNGDLIAARAALAASQAEFQRASHLYAEQKNVSLKALQSARATYLGDESRVEVLRQQLRDQWGGEIALMNPRARADFVAALIARRKAIARVSLPLGQALDRIPNRARVVVPGRAKHPLTARAVYPAPMVDPLMQGQSFLLWIDSPSAIARPGAAVTAWLPTTSNSEQGIMVPRSAVVRYEGRAWVYQETRPGRFTRRRLVVAESSRDGYFVTAILDPGMRIVVTGAQALLSQELQARIQVED